MAASREPRRWLRLLLKGTDDAADAGHRCPRCGGPLEPNAGGPGYGVLFAPSPAEELCEPCLTGHSPGWIPPVPEPDWWLGRVLYRNPIARSLRDQRNRRETD
jgi:hypothetical protein